MKKPPKIDKLEEVLMSSKLVRGGFLGIDKRSVAEIINADAFDVSKLGYDTTQIAGKMQEITDIAKTGMGTWVAVDDKRKAMTQEAKGMLVCPWPHPAGFDKRVTTVKLVDSKDTIYWADLNIHLISEHGFFEGKGSDFRIEPQELIKIIF